MLNNGAIGLLTLSLTGTDHHSELDARIVAEVCLELAEHFVDLLLGVGFLFFCFR